MTEKGDAPLEQPPNSILREYLYEELNDIEHGTRVLYEFSTVPASSTKESNSLYEAFEARREAAGDMPFPNNEKGVLYEFVLRAWSEARANPSSGIETIELQPYNNFGAVSVRINGHDPIPCISIYPGIIDELASYFKIALDVGTPDLIDLDNSYRLHSFEGGFMRTDVDKTKSVTRVLLGRSSPEDLSEFGLAG